MIDVAMFNPEGKKNTFPAAIFLYKKNLLGFCEGFRPVT